MSGFEEERIAWVDDAPAPPETARLQGERQADIAIIGAGYTGLWAALRLAERGLNVVVLEAHGIGHGASGRNVGLVNAGLWSEPVLVERRLGIEAGVRFYRALADGPRRVFEAIDRLRIPAEAVRNGTLHLAGDENQMDELRFRRDQLVGRRAPVRLIDAAETAERTGTDAYLGALFDPRAGTVQPMALVRGVARAAIAAGAVIHTDTRVEAVRKAEGRWRIALAGGRLSADSVLMATNAYSFAGAEAVRRSVIQAHYFQVATAPLRIKPAESILPGGEGCWDAATVMTSFRRDAAGRLILGSLGRLPSGRAGAHGAWAERKIQALFPDLGPTPIRRAWSGAIALTADNVPRITELAPGLVAVYGFNGRGIAPALVLGTAAADYLVDRAPEDLPLPLEIEPHFAPFRDFRGAMAELGATLWHRTASR